MLICSGIDKFTCSTPFLPSVPPSQESLPSAVCHDTLLGQAGHFHQSHLGEWSVDESTDAAVVVIMASKKSEPASLDHLTESEME